MPTSFLCWHRAMNTGVLSIVYHTFALRRSTSFPWIHIVVGSQFSFDSMRAAEQHHFPLQRKDKYLISFIFVRVCMWRAAPATCTWVVWYIQFQCFEIHFELSTLRTYSSIGPKYTRTHTIATHIKSFSHTQQIHWKFVCHPFAIRKLDTCFSLIMWNWICYICCNAEWTFYCVAISAFPWDRRHQRYLKTKPVKLLTLWARWKKIHFR